MNLCRFDKPSRYINGEINSIYKKNALVRVALAFPDIYDIGMSHLGLKILYDIINNLPNSSAERVFSPWIDMEAEMKDKKIPLLSLETKTPLNGFDIVGFSLQYELCYTTVLNMLSLGGIPVRSGERNEKHPLIIAGGPCTINPLPMSAFIDAFLIGDGEDAIVEIVEAFFEWKTEGDGKRKTLLKGLAKIEGMHIPSIHGSGLCDRGAGVHQTPLVKRRYIKSLDTAPYPVAPIVPFTSLIHDRINIELSRGCTMGCRFCQAGMIYRPLRERSPEKVLEIAEASLKNTGHEEISLTSLSAGDYGCLLPVVKELNKRFSHKMVSLSLPSLRVAAVRQEVLKEIKTVRKSGFTIAPEAATEKLRAAINKDFGEEDYDRALNALFAEGWENLKLYFMVGLPTETHEDIEAIPEMALKAITTAKKYTHRYININVSVSPFVPKTHTPMQWYGQEDIEKIQAKMTYLRRSLIRYKIGFKSHNKSMSLLEAVFSRGDSRLSDLIEKAWELGCRLDAWTEAFDFRKWLEAAEITGINIYEYAKRHYSNGDVLPWDRLLDTGIQKEFIQKEFRKIDEGSITKDCSKQCHACGLGCRSSSGLHATSAGGNDIPLSVSERENILGGLTFKNALPLPLVIQPVKVRVQFSKTGNMRHLSHRELITTITRALRRSNIPVVYSMGFHPSPRISFGPPLNVGIIGLKEYFDMELQPFFSIPNLEDSINVHMPEGLRLNHSSAIPLNAPSLDSFISRYEYEILCPDSQVVNNFLEKNSLFVERINASNKKTVVDIRRMVDEASTPDANTVRLTVSEKGDKKVRLGELLTAIFRMPQEDLMVTRLSMYGWQGIWVEPLYFSEKITTAEIEFIKKEQKEGCAENPAVSAH